MASSDDEGEAVPNNVSDYVFKSSEYEPISFAKLPVEWNKGEAHERKPKQFFVSGKTDNGLRTIFTKVIAWKFDLSYDKPQISVLALEGYWIRLLKPRKAFEDIIRTILITVHLLHFAKYNPQRPQKALWDHLNRTFSMFERRPSQDDLVDHLPLINEAVKRDVTLANSKLLSTILEEKPVKRRTLNEDVKPSFIVDDADENDNVDELDKTGENEDDEDEDDCFDSVCAICDNGGNLLICDGKCMRSFHPTVEDGDESNCDSLALTEEELEAIRDVPFYCENCENKQHQCFACGELGSSDESSNPEVFCCVNGACGFFYHPHCVAKLLHPGDNAAAEEHQKKIAAGEKFACPAHTCHACKELEVRSIEELQFAVCRRCPRSYHRKCLPREIALEKDVDLERGIIQRAWDGLIPNRLLIYCLEHEINPEYSTPDRTHIKFRPEQENKNELPAENSNKKYQLKESRFALEDKAGKAIPAKSRKGVEKVSSRPTQGDLCRREVVKLPAGGTSKMQKATNRKYLGKVKEPTADGGELSLGNKLFTLFAKDSEPVKSGGGASVDGEPEITQRVKPTANRKNDFFTLDADTRKRVFKLMEDASSSLTLDQVKKRHKTPSTHTQYAKFYVDNVTLGKVEGSVQAVRAALKELEEGGSIQDAKKVCGNDLLVQVLRWKDKMKVYLAPFLYGMRYTSFGRHFTKMDKLIEIVEMLHWYVQDDDMLVDFCCGSNDFSCLMKKKLDEMGKRCSFKNYDILQAKNDFNFERRDWMDVTPDELPDGSQLIMGLNPPFGVNAVLANKFINKALEFKPKLLILIVPRETQRLDQKEFPYDLIWEDDQMCAGKSFYLPGSVDVNDKQIEDWNVSAPVVYLWSRPSWTSKHKAIAEQYGHPSGAQNKCKLEENHNDISSPQEHRDSGLSYVNQGGEDPVKLEELEQEEKIIVTASKQEDLPRVTEGDNKDNTLGKNQLLEENPKKLGGSKRKKKKRSNNTSLEEDKSAVKRPKSRHPSPNVEKHSPTTFENPSQLIVHSRRYQQQLDEMNISTHNQPYGEPAAYNNNNETLDDVVRRYNPNGGQSHAPSPNHDFGFMGPAERFMGHPEVGSNSSFPYRPPYMGEIEEYGPSWNPRPVCRPPYQGPPGFPSPYGQLNPAGNSTYSEMNTSAMQRYAPRLDELNHGQMSNMVHRPPLHDASGGMYLHSRAPGPVASSHISSLGFASGPYRPYSQHNSSGWLNE